MEQDMGRQGGCRMRVIHFICETFTLQVERSGTIAYIRPPKIPFLISKKLV